MSTLAAVREVREEILPVSTAERRRETRETIPVKLWMIDHQGSTVLPCRCEDVSQHGMRLVVPMGYGIAEGQRYELRATPPDAQRRSTEEILLQGRWATIVRTRLEMDQHGAHLDVGVSFDA